MLWEQRNNQNQQFLRFMDKKRFFQNDPNNVFYPEMLIFMEIWTKNGLSKIILNNVVFVDVLIFLDIWPINHF